MLQHYLPLLIILAAGVFYAVYFKKLTLPAAVVGTLIATIIFISFNYTGLIIMTVFFLMGTLATSHKTNVKKQLGIAEENKGRRTAGQVFANAGVAGVLGLLMVMDTQHKELYLVMVAAAFSSATADTISSELGNVYGRKFYNILTFKKDQRGLNGVISLEGTLAGVLGSIIIAVVYACFEQFDKRFIVIIVAGTIGNIVDSLLGATLEKRQVIGNNVVNFLNTILAAITALLLMLVWY
jgi:uncharacterized protein (TIGR00297 family)